MCIYITGSDLVFFITALFRGTVKIRKINTLHNVL